MRTLTLIFAWIGVAGVSFVFLALVGMLAGHLQEFRQERCARKWNITTRERNARRAAGIENPKGSEI